MRTIADPPPPPPGSPPSEPHVPSSHFSLVLTPCSDPTGGTIVSSISLETQTPIRLRIEENLDPAWASIPLYHQRFGAYQFSILRPGAPGEPAPSEIPEPTGRDAAMLAALEENLPAKISLTARNPSLTTKNPRANGSTGTPRSKRAAAPFPSKVIRTSMI